MQQQALQPLVKAKPVQRLMQQILNKPEPQKQL
jgi:hypothetical protein